MRKFLTGLVVCGSGVVACMQPAYSQTVAAPTVPVEQSDADSEQMVQVADNTMMFNNGTNPTSAATAAPSGAVPAAPGQPIPMAVLQDYIEGGGSVGALSHNEGNLTGEYVRGEMQGGPNDRWQAGVSHEHEFHGDDSYISVGNVHTFDPDWYSNVTVGANPRFLTGTSHNSNVFGDSILFPDYRLDVFLNRKLLENGNLIATGGLETDKFSDGHKDYSAYLGTTYYFTTPWIVQEGVRFNVSSPGSVTSLYFTGAVTYGTNKYYYLTGQLGFGREAYQVIGTGKAISDFASHDVGVVWRQWMLQDWGFDGNWGFNTSVDYYSNPIYHRIGMTVGVFREF